MSDTQLHLFEVEPFGNDPAAHRSTIPPPSAAVEPYAEPWVLVRRRDGVQPYFHLERCRSTNGAIATMCGLIGSKISSISVDAMIRCPTCAVAAEMA